MGLSRLVLMFLQWSVNRWFYIFCFFGVSSIFWMTYKINSVAYDGRASAPVDPRLSLQPQDSTNPRLHQPQDLPKKSQLLETNSLFIDNKPSKPTKPLNLAVENRALLILAPEETYSTIAIAFVHSRLKHEDLYYHHSGIKRLTKTDSLGLYSVIVFSDLKMYLLMTGADRIQIDKYCKAFGVGLIFFTKTPGEEITFNNKVLDFPLTFSTGVAIKNYTVAKSSLADIAKPLVPIDVSSFKPWTVFHPNHTTYQVVSVGTVSTTPGSATSSPVVLLDSGQLDGIRRIFFGHEHSIWIHKILFLDCLSILTRKAMRVSKAKLIQIDIDDIFLGKNGTKMKPADVTALVNAQRVWRENYVPGFSFFLGFSAKFFKRGLKEEAEGDEEIIKQASHFQWFDHTYSHVQAHKYTKLAALVKEMEMSKQFAETHGLSVTSSYSVAPHHSGVYPTHDLLYDAWKQVWNITVTSTEEYPHLKPPWYLRGFVYKDIKVLPRQVCGLYTKNLFYSEYPRGPEELEYNILGGDLFDTVLYNYLNIYMTHQQNYGNDRLAIYTFDKLFKLFKRHTTLELQGAPPRRIAHAYFTKYPKEVQPVWYNPCADPRHLEIWNDEKHCSKLPSLLVVGPQKTGSTALYTFLKLHPNITSNTDSPTSFEELQFFGSDNYRLGLDWYMNFFSTEQGVSFEKSATYFDREAVPRQAYALLPQAKIVIILLDPIARAFSWYHHQRAHKDPVALSTSFYDVVTSSSDADQSIQSLKARLIKPGFYYEHIQRWRQYYPNSQVAYVDGERLKVDPVAVMSDMQRFLQLEPQLDYSQFIIYDKSKGFYCTKTSEGNSKCLGKGKGRIIEYGEVDKRSHDYLKQVFVTPNLYLKQLLRQLNQPLPSWL